jgi:hypothetical protein
MKRKHGIAAITVALLALTSSAGAQGQQPAESKNLGPDPARCGNFVKAQNGGKSLVSVKYQAWGKYSFVRQVDLDFFDTGSGFKFFYTGSMWKPNEHGYIEQENQGFALHGKVGGGTPYDPNKKSGGPGQIRGIPTDGIAQDGTGQHISTVKTQSRVLIARIDDALRYVKPDSVDSMALQCAKHIVNTFGERHQRVETKNVRLSNSSLKEGELIDLSGNGGWKLKKPAAQAPQK